MAFRTSVSSPSVPARWLLMAKVTARRTFMRWPKNVSMIDGQYTIDGATSWRPLS
jgi:hypothetical protein